MKEGERSWNEVLPCTKSPGFGWEKTVKCFAHSGREPTFGDWQLLAEHLRKLGQIAAGLIRNAIGDEGLAQSGKIAGLLHDLGKYRPEFQQMLLGLPEIAHDQLKDRLANTQLPHVLLKVSQTTGKKCPCQLLKLAPKVPAGWQTVGGWQLADAPAGLPEGTIVLGVAEHRIARFQEVVGRLPSLQKKTGSKLPGNRRR